MFGRFDLGLVVALAGCGPRDTCVAEGDGFDVKLGIDGPCCDGLLAVNPTLQPDGEGGCAIVDLDPSRVCIACGDGECGADENPCNCVADCP